MAEPRYNTYIGARYVPLFCGDWDNTLEYEPLSIVSYEGNSYTSRTFVPTGVAITNTDYWFVSGNYNQQVESYRREVVQYKEDLEQDMSSLEGNVATMVGEVSHRVDTNANNISDLKDAQIQLAVSTQYKSLDIMCNALWSVISIMQRGETLDIDNNSTNVNIYVQGDTIFIKTEDN